MYVKYHQRVITIKIIHKVFYIIFCLLSLWNRMCVVRLRCISFWTSHISALDCHMWGVTVLERVGSEFIHFSSSSLSKQNLLQTLSSRACFLTLQSFLSLWEALSTVSRLLIGASQ